MQDVAGRSTEGLKRCDANYSFYFDLIIKELWGTMAKANQDDGRSTIHRICTLARKMRVQSLICETLESNEEISQEAEAYAKWLGRSVTASAKRVTFFSKYPENGNICSLTNEDILGYAVIISLQSDSKSPPLTYILESVIRPPRVQLGESSSHSVTNYYVHCFRDFTTTVGSGAGRKSFTFPGTFFCQQNGSTHVCGHAAIRTAINSYPGFTDAKLTNNRINELLGINHVETKLHPDGLQVSKMIDLVKELGFQPHVGEFRMKPHINYEEFIYPIIESACPVILNIANQNISHVVTILGHTLNSDRWAEAFHGYRKMGTVRTPSYISASAWTDHFIQSDDNFGMYVTLPVDQIKNILIPKYNPHLYAAIGLGIMPRTVTGFGDRAERVSQGLATAVLSVLQDNLSDIPNPSRWIPMLIKHKEEGRIVLRTLHSKREDYISQLSTSNDEVSGKLSESSKLAIERILPNEFWVTEISLPDIFSGNKHKLGDIVTRSDLTDNNSDEKSCEPIVWWWICGLCQSLDIADEGNQKINFDFDLRGHVPLLRSQPRVHLSSEW